jgi:hypothetical protein
VRRPKHSEDLLEQVEVGAVGWDKAQIHAMRVAGFGDVFDAVGR